jgi:hypothetical protein
VAGCCDIAGRAQDAESWGVPSVSRGSEVLASLLSKSCTRRLGRESRCRCCLAFTETRHWWIEPHPRPSPSRRSGPQGGPPPEESLTPSLRGRGAIRRRVGPRPGAIASLLLARLARDNDADEHADHQGEADVSAKYQRGHDRHYNAEDCYSRRRDARPGEQSADPTPDCGPHGFIPPGVFKFSHRSTARIAGCRKRKPVRRNRTSFMTSASQAAVRLPREVARGSPPLGGSAPRRPSSAVRSRRPPVWCGSSAVAWAPTRTQNPYGRADRASASARKSTYPAP